MHLFVFVVFVVKQKTAYELRISDWISDVCSSDLLIAERSGVPTSAIRRGRYGAGQINSLVDASGEVAGLNIHFYHRPWIDPTQLRLATARLIRRYGEIGRASCRERVSLDG